MKIGIFTQPLFTNYGGLLQCYALMKVLKRLGHQPEVVHRVRSLERSCWYNDLYHNIMHFLWCLKHLHFTGRIGNKQKIILSQQTVLFVNKYITPRTENLYSTQEVQNCVKRNGYDVLIAGSDQCWRPYYSPCITNYFFDFAKTIPCEKISYAASFGVDNWEFSKKETEKCAELAKQFDAISVREFSAIDLCKKHLRVEAEQVIDPTMLLRAEDYIHIVESENENPSPGNLFCYILDEAPPKRNVIYTVADKMNLKPFTAMPRKEVNMDNVTHYIQDCVYPRVTQWLRAFMDAEMIVTDSFHGCVFSILFNKPFWVIGNEGRGLARFDTLLSIFHLKDRLVTVNQCDNIDWSVPIDWIKVNKTLEQERQRGLDFLKEHLK